MLANPIARLRLIGLIESLSSFALFFIAVPIKWVPFLIRVSDGMPTDEAKKDLIELPVRIVGSVHGGLFILFVIALLHVIWTIGLPRGTVVRALFSAILPFPFEPLVLDPKLRALQQKLASQPEPA